MRLPKPFARFSGPINLLRNIKWQHTSYSSDLPVAFVMGAPRSGTTLLQKLISQHSMTYSIESETGLFTYTDLFAPNRRHFGFQGEQLRNLMAQSGSAAELLDRGVRMVAARDAVPAEAIFVEKTPQHCLYAARIARSFPKAYFIEITRDGRDCFASAKRHGGIPQSRSAKAFAKYWARCVEAPLSDGFQNRAGQRHIRVRYEELCTKPDEVMKAVMQLMRLDLEDGQLSASKRSTDVRASRQEFARLNEAISAGSVGGWQDRLSAEEAATFMKVAGAAMHRLGYA